MNNHDPYAKRSLWREQKPQRKEEPPSILPIVVVAVAAIALIVGVRGMVARASPPPQPTVIVAATVQPTATPLVATPTPIQATATPVCNAGSVYLKVITDQEGQGKWDQAAENAASALNDKDLCGPDRPILAQKYVTDAMEGLYALPFDPSRDAQERMVKQYQTIVRTAARHGAEPPSPLSIAQRAAQGGKFLLAKAAYDEALSLGSFNTSDINLVDSYANNLTSIGVWWTQDKSSSDFNEGLAYLSAANQITLHYKTGNREAWGKLKELLGPDETKWPAPTDTPLLGPDASAKTM